MEILITAILVFIITITLIYASYKEGYENGYADGNNKRRPRMLELRFVYERYATQIWRMLISKWRSNKKRK